MESCIHCTSKHVSRSLRRVQHHVRRSRSLSTTPAVRATVAIPSRSPPQQQQVSRHEEVEEVPANFKMEDLSSMAQREIETHRELRKLARTAAWDMPKLFQLRKEFVPPTKAEPLRWRYTTYLGEEHPAANKVVVEFSVKDLPEMTDEQRDVLRKIAGVRWDFRTDIVKMSCESFAEKAQNKRFLADTIQKLVHEAKNGEDKFADIPLDKRHVARRMTWRERPELVRAYPTEWKLNYLRKLESSKTSDAQPAQIEDQAQQTRQQAARLLGEPSENQATEDMSEEEAYAMVREAAVQAGEIPGEVPEYATISATPGVVDGMQAIADAYRARAYAKEIGQDELPAVAEVNAAAQSGARRQQQRRTQSRRR